MISDSEDSDAAMDKVDAQSRLKDSFPVLLPQSICHLSFYPQLHLPIPHHFTYTSQSFGLSSHNCNYY